MTGKFTAGLAVALLVPSAAAPRAEDVVETRQRLMVSMIGATKVVRAMVQGSSELDALKVKDAVGRVLEANSVLPALFPEGSITSVSAAKASILTNRADFNARFLELEKASVALAFAAQSGPDEVAYAFGDYTRVCDGCHETYRKAD